MSLLMDALKKAEEEKKRAAKRLEEVEADAHSSTGGHELSEKIKKTKITPNEETRTVKLSLEPLAHQASSAEEKLTTDGKKVADDFEIKNEKIEEDGFTTLALKDNSAEVSMFENTIINEAFDSESQVPDDLNDTTIVEGLSADNIEAPFDDTFHGVLLNDDTYGTNTYEETLPGVPAETLAKDLAGDEHQPTPVAAQTVFSAGKSGKTNKPFRWVTFSVLTVLAIATFSIFYYFSITPVTRQLPSPLVARGIEAAPVPLSIPSPIVNEDVVSGVVIASEAQGKVNLVDNAFIEPENTMEVSEEKVLLTATQHNIKVDDIAPSFNENNIIDKPVVKTLSNVPETMNVTESDRSIGGEVQQEEIDNNLPKDSFDGAFVVAVDDMQTASSLIEISKMESTKEQTDMISSAFNAYKVGDYVLAQTLYEDVLKKEPDNRDSHLGLAAIAINEKNYAVAHSHYTHLLELNSDDVLALNALVNLSNSANYMIDESMIKTLLQKEEAPFLYFSLGNIYARQQRWAEAQQAFFDAYRLDASNPDYVLNLAISLDQLGQYSSALNYYKITIGLAQNVSTRFNLVSVKERIKVLDKLSS